MAYVLTNGKYYIKVTHKGTIGKTDNINEARVYLTIDKARERMEKAPGKTKGYYILDVGKKLKYYLSNGRIKYPKEVRELLYHEAGGRCRLCGREITVSTMTIDHIIPLVMGGTNSIDNLQCVCEVCNRIKGSTLPDEFMEHVTNIFLYQMENRYKEEIKWKIVQRILDGMV